MADVELGYYVRTKKGNLITDEDLDLIIKFSEGFKNTRKELITRYPNLEIKIYIHSDSPKNLSPNFLVNFEGDKTEIKEAIDMLIRFNGTPSFVYGCYDITNQVLKKYGKTTERRFFGFLVGKQVVDL